MKHNKQLTAQELYDWLKELHKYGVNLSKVDVNYRHNYESDVEEVYGVIEDLRDSSDNETLTSICLVTDLSEVQSFLVSPRNGGERRMD